MLCCQCKDEAIAFVWKDQQFYCKAHYREFMPYERAVRIGSAQVEWVVVAELVVRVKELTAKVEALEKRHAGAHGNAVMSVGLDERVVCVVCGHMRGEHETIRVALEDGTAKWDLRCKVCDCPRFNGG